MSEPELKKKSTPHTPIFITGLIVGTIKSEMLSEYLVNEIETILTK
jgi:hypothetical protein